ncbi:hypothetical protein PF004_g27900 [Phytophthora fragariae]|uniref:Uncharacterized protein n=1 Tax=Phytophthora fragariae TaxID=53985 RepID=A0A6G0MJ82_9STRA|nr:hypothetical protein PF004_g27900 [Phytophthora fragariae]
MGVEPFDADAASDCDSGGHPWQLDGDTGSDSCSDDQGRTSSGYSDSGGRQWRLESSRSTQTPPPIATSAATPGRSTETPAATPAPTIKARVEPFDADAASDCDLGGHPWQIDGDNGSDFCSDDQGRSSSGYSDSDGRLWRLESSRSTQTPPPIDSGGRQWRLESSRSTQTLPPITTPADVCGGSSRAVRRRRRLRLRLRRTSVEARVEPFDADAASDCDSGGHPWQLDGDTGTDSCSDDQGRSSSGYSDSDGRLWMLESSRSTQTPPPIATPAATPGSSTETPAATPAPTIKVGAAAAIPTPADACGGSSRAVRRRRRLRLRLGRPPLADRRRHRQRLLLRRSRSEQQRLFRLRRTPVEAGVEPFDADAASD